MNFLYPPFLLAALAVAIPVVLHLLRRDVAPAVPFSAVRLLKKSPVERSRRRRLRDLLLLAARVAALLLLAAAFARPFIPGAASAMQPLRIVAVDRSYSMGAPGRFEKALDLARAAVGEATFGERVAVMAFDDRAEVLAPPGGAAEARAALATLAPGNGATRYAAVLSAASELATGGAARLIVITDLQRTGWEGETRARVPDSLQVETRDAGLPPGNLAVVAARHDARGLVATVRNASGTARRGTITAAQDGSPAGRAEYAVAPHATMDIAVPLTLAPSRGVRIAIDDETGFQADNSRYLVAGAAEAPAVLIVASADSPGFFLTRALDAAHAGEASDLQTRLVSPGEIAGGRSATLSKYRAVVLLSTRSLDRAARDGIAASVRAGGGLLIAGSADVEPAVVAALFGWPASGIAPADARDATLTVTDGRHPIFQPFGTFAANLGSVRFTRAWRIDGAGWNVLARFDDGSAALVERSEGRGKVVIFASDLDRRWNDFPLHPAFVPFVAEAVRHLVPRTATSVELVVGRVPSGTASVPGIHTLDSGRLVAVNVDPRESGTGVMTAAEFAAMIESAAETRPDHAVRDEQTESRQNLWQYGLMLMVGVLVVESFVGKA